jgi:hypothetical protein
MKLIVFSTGTIRTILDEFQYRTELTLNDPDDFIVYALYAAFEEEVDESEEDVLLAVNGLDRLGALPNNLCSMLEMYLEDLLDEMERILELVAGKSKVLDHKWFGEDLGIYLEQ